jgi:hypothetical protein
MPLPVQNDNQFVVGGQGYFFAEERKSTGAALDTPDTANKVSKIGAVTFEIIPQSTSENIKIKDNSGFENLVRRAKSLGASSVAPEGSLKFNLVEGSVAALDFFATVRGKYYAITIPLAQYYDGATLKKTEIYMFGQFEDGGAIVIDPDTPTQIPIVFNMKNNSASCATATNADSALSATSVTIAANAGYKINAAA